MFHTNSRYEIVAPIMLLFIACFIKFLDKTYNKNKTILMKKKEHQSSLKLYTIVVKSHKAPRIKAFIKEIKIKFPKIILKKGHGKEGKINKHRGSDHFHLYIETNEPKLIKGGATHTIDVDVEILSPH